MGYYRNNRKVESGNAAAGGRAFPFYDGNGNICGYTNASGIVQTCYLYDGFLNVTQTGTTSYRYQASTKSWNPALGLLEYQFRAYAPELGRWIQEYPIEEKGGKNLYCFVKNNAVSIWDLLGWKIVSSCPIDEYIEFMGVTGFDRAISSQKYTYSGNPKYDKSDLAAEIIGRMIEAKEEFQLDDCIEKDGKIEKSTAKSIEALSGHIDARKRIIANTHSFQEYGFPVGIQKSFS